jgi:hypothetical protein
MLGHLGTRQRGGSGNRLGLLNQDLEKVPLRMFDPPAQVLFGLGLNARFGRVTRLV